MRASGCLRGAPLMLWERGILARLPDCFNQPIVGAAPEERPGPAPSGRLRPAHARRVAVAGPGHRRADHRRPAPALPAAHGGSARRVLGLRHRVRCRPRRCTATWSCPPGWRRRRPPSAPHTWCRSWSAKGWPLLAEVAPAAAAVVTPLARDPGPLVDALATTPHTFVHSNWKLDNLGTDDAGRTVVLDWEQPGRGAPPQRPGLVPGHQLPPPAAVEGGLDRGLPGRAGGVRHRHRALVGPPAGAVPAGRAGPVRLGEGARRLRRGARMVGDAGGQAAPLLG